MSEPPQAMGYREDPEALERRRGDLVRRMRTLEARWTDAFWREIAPARGLHHPGPEPAIAELAALAERVAALEAVEAHHGAVMLDWSTPPAAPRRTARSLGGEPDVLARELRRRRASGAQRERAARLVERLEAGVAPMAVDARLAPHDRSATRHDHAALTLELAAPLAPGVASLALRPETLWDELRNALGSRELELQHPTFDGAFRIEGDEETARRVLDAETRDALLLLGASHRAELAIGPGEVRVGAAVVELDDLDASGAPSGASRDAVEALLTVLRSARRAPVRRLRVAPG